MLILVVLRVKLGNYSMMEVVLQLVHCCSFSMLNIALNWNLFTVYCVVFFNWWNTQWIFSILKMKIIKNYHWSSTKKSEKQTATQKPPSPLTYSKGWLLPGWAVSLKVPNRSSAQMWTCRAPGSEVAHLHLPELPEALPLLRAQDGCPIHICRKVCG